jgi:hypothetical protein
MSKDSLVESPTQSWKAGWKGNERSQLRSWLEATPAQRLAWLEEAIELAYQAGALEPKQLDT